MPYMIAVSLEMSDEPLFLENIVGYGKEKALC
jgi:hypothetical protein